MEGGILNELKIALLQVRPGACTEENLETGIRYCRQAREMGADIAPVPGDVEQRLRYLRSPGAGVAGRSGTGSGRVCGRFCRPGARAGYGDSSNLSRAVRAGAAQFARSLRQARPAQAALRPRCTPATFGAERYLTPGEDFFTCTLDTACGEVKVGAMICYDR